MNLGLYIHIPFCRQKCYYCDFPSYASLEHLFLDYVNALCQEIIAQGILHAGNVFDTVYIGGGTPTVLSESQLMSIIDCIKENMQLSHDVEWSMEANPGTVNYALLKSLHQGGLTRLSIGVQTFQDKLLENIGRIHNGQQAQETIQWTQQAGFENINVDLMYGLPDQTLEDIYHSIRLVVESGVQHISVYGLKIEEGTVFAEQMAKGKLLLPDEEEETAMYSWVTRYLPTVGFERYEISNYARPGFVSRHNTKYWRYRPYLGVGAAACSFLGGVRRTNTANPAEYINTTVNSGQPATEYEKISRENAMAEYAFLGLRLADGISREDFMARFGVDFLKQYSDNLQQLEQQGLIKWQNNRLALTGLGMQFGNIVFRSFLPK